MCWANQRLWAPASSARRATSSISAVEVKPSKNTPIRIMSLRPLGKSENGSSHSFHDDQPVSVGIVRQQFAAGVGDQDHVLVLHAEAEPGLVDQRLDAEHHTGLERLIVGRTEIRVLVQVQPDAVSNEGDSRQLQFTGLVQVKLVDGAARRARLDGVEQ